MRDGERPLDVAHHERLGVLADAGPRRGITHMAHGDAAFQVVQHVVAERFRHKAHRFRIGDHAAVVHRDAAAFLPPVLQGEQAVVSGVGGVHRPVGEDAEDAAFLAGVFVGDLRGKPSALGI